MFKGKSILVAGGAGFIGTNLTRKLHALGAKLRVTTHHKQPLWKDSKIEYLSCDLTRPEDCAKVVQDMDYVFMCAASTSGAKVIRTNPMIHVTPNIVMNALMLEAAYHAKIKKFVWLSSNAAYPPTGDRPVKEEEMMQGDPYESYYHVGWMKRYTEILCRTYSEKIKEKMLCVVLRPSNIYGPYDDYDFETSHVTASIIRKVVEHQQPIVMWGSGKDIRDVLYIDDLIDGILLAAEKLHHFEPLNIALGKAYSLMDILHTALEIEGYRNAQIQCDASKPSTIPVRLIDNSKAKKVIGFEPKVDLKEGLKKTIAWYHEFYSSKGIVPNTARL